MFFKFCLFFFSSQNNIQFDFSGKIRLGGVGEEGERDEGEGKMSDRGGGRDEVRGVKEVSWGLRNYPVWV